MFVRCLNRIATLAKIRKIYNNSEKKSMWVDFYFEANALCLGKVSITTMRQLCFGIR